MIRFVTPDDIPGVRSLIKECFGCDDAYLDLYLERNPAPRRMCCIEAGRVVAFLAAFPVDYISGEISGGFHRTWHGYYLHGLCTAPEYRNRGHAAALIDYCASTTGRDGWEFLILRPQSGDNRLVKYYHKLGFTIELSRKTNLPECESPANIVARHAGELFLDRYKKLRCNFFQWSAPMLHYIIREARLNSGSSGISSPYAMIRPFSTDFRLSSPDAVFSYPMD